MYAAKLAVYVNGHYSPSRVDVLDDCLYEDVFLVEAMSRSSLESISVQSPLYLFFVTLFCLNYFYVHIYRFK